MVPPRLLREWNAKLSSTLRSTFAKILESPIDNKLWLQYILPHSRGGLGLSDPLFLAAGSFISSCFSALKFWKEAGNNEIAIPGCYQALSDLGLYMGSTSEACLALAHSQDFAGYASLQPSVLVQHWWTHSMTAKAFRESRSSDTPREQLRLKLLTSDHGGEWLLLNPCRRLGTLVSSAEFRLLLRFRLGITLSASPRLCGCCHKLLSAPEELKGDHAICCIKAGYVRRHYVMCDHLKYLLTVAGLRWEAEIYVNAQRSLRADLVVHSFVDGKPLALDVQVVHGLSSRLGEEAVAKGENDKKAKYSAACSMIDMNFSPVVWDTLGGLGPDSLKFMQKLITAAAAGSSQPIDTANYLWQRTALALARAVARQLSLSMS